MNWPRKITPASSFPNLKPPIPKIITFDAYNTLYSTRLPVTEQYYLVGRKYGIEVNPRMINRRFPLVFEELKSLHPTYGKYSGISANRWWSLLIRNVFHPVVLPKEMIDELLVIFRGPKAYKVFSDVRSFILAAKSHDPRIILGIISNSDPIVYTLLENIGLGGYFDGYIYLSYNLDAKKPGKEIFEKALADIVNKNPELKQIRDLKSRCWHIGDERTNDMLAAFNAGWNGILLDRMNKYKSLSRSNCSDSNMSHHRSALQNDIVQTGEGTYVISDLNCLKHMLL